LKNAERLELTSTDATSVKELGKSWSEVRARGPLSGTDRRQSEIEETDLTKNQAPSQVKPLQPAMTNKRFPRIKPKPIRPARTAAAVMYEYHRPTNRISQLESRSRPARCHPNGMVFSALNARDSQARDGRLVETLAIPPATARVLCHRSWNIPTRPEMVARASDAIASIWGTQRPQAKGRGARDANDSTRRVDAS